MARSTKLERIVKHFDGELKNTLVGLFHEASRDAWHWTRASEATSNWYVKLRKWRLVSHERCTTERGEVPVYFVKITELGCKLVTDMGWDVERALIEQARRDDLDRRLTGFDPDSDE